MKKTILMLLIAIAMVSVACNKDQNAVKKLDGKWLVKTIDGSVVGDDEAFTIRFDNCKLKKDEYCTAYQAAVNDTTAFDLTYKVQSEGTVLILRVEDEDGEFEDISNTIDELSKDELILTQTAFGTASKYVFEKI
ncbi:hypothetical protein DNU06_00780 [Putridiphycobacter roseus]|uniref:Lipocalin-like domain-containing protein n=1 Tax=Putridiphycobacter roseus TaxID=2219161 RepID=A0A2W1N3G6_9FLAO|nr:hypothetical protein [Putridiphycobacter roseus]PZE18404.1 hypothetical protein DNU06_00780 [Putridiphycobacter roseus]